MPFHGLWERIVEIIEAIISLFMSYIYTCIICHIQQYDIDIKATQTFLVDKIGKVVSNSIKYAIIATIWP